MMRAFAAVGLLSLAGCELFVGIPVECTSRQIINLDQKATPARAGGACAFADPYPFTVSYSPRADRTAVSASGRRYSTSDDRLLVGQPVTVTQSSAATLLCTGVNDACADGKPSITVPISTSGQLAYQGLFALERLQVVLGEGDTFQWEGVVATENFASGSSCPLTAKIQLSCQKIE
jgi:hypothetical protein